jgi:mannose-6-phosphate isomerase
MGFISLPRQAVSKPWGRRDLPAAFGAYEDSMGEIWFDDPLSPLPLLVKWLFTSEKLSVQVHPNNQQAAAAGLERGKEECWIVIDAEPGAVLGIGTKRPLSAAELYKAAVSSELETLMDWKPVRAGDWFHIAPGTVHAIGAGVTLVEIQQNADVTYRLYDYGRPRELHLEEGVAVSRAEPYVDSRHGQLDMKANLKLLTQCAAFSVFHGRGQSFETVTDTNYWLVPIAGEIRLETGIFSAGSVLYGRCGGATWVSPDFSYLVAYTIDENGHCRTQMNNSILPQTPTLNQRVVGSPPTASTIL